MYACFEIKEKQNYSLYLDIDTQESLLYTCVAPDEGSVSCTMLVEATRWWVCCWCVLSIDCTEVAIAGAASLLWEPWDNGSTADPFSSTILSIARLPREPCKRHTSLLQNTNHTNEWYRDWKKIGNIHLSFRACFHSRNWHFDSTLIVHSVDATVNELHHSRKVSLREGSDRSARQEANRARSSACTSDPDAFKFPANKCGRCYCVVYISGSKNNTEEQ